MFWLIEGTNSLIKIGAMQAFLVVIGAGFGGPVCALVTRMFPVSERFSGIAFGWSIGLALLGGTAPLICMTLVQWTGDPKAPAYFLTFCGLIAI